MTKKHKKTEDEEDGLSFIERMVHERDALLEKARFKEQPPMFDHEHEGDLFTVDGKKFYSIKYLPETERMYGLFANKPPGSVTKYKASFADNPHVVFRYTFSRLGYDANTDTVFDQIEFNHKYLVSNNLVELIYQFLCEVERSKPCMVRSYERRRDDYLKMTYGEAWETNK